jgi:hypothetical protein
MTDMDDTEKVTFLTPRDSNSGPPIAQPIGSHCDDGFEVYLTIL